MMISPEGYYKCYLEGKSKEAIASNIRSLKREIGHLKKTIEHPDYETMEHICPDEHTRLWCCRLYLEKAIEAYKAAGVEYRPTKAEQSATEFEADIPSISKITLSIGGFFAGRETRTVTLTDEHLQLWIENSIIPTPSNFDIEPDYPVTKEAFLEGLKELHIGEWRRNYDSSDYGVYILDGTQWELKIEYNDGRKAAEYSGSNAYPFSFNELCSLMGKDDDLEEENDDE